MDVWRTANERASIWMPDGDTLDLNWHIHARIHGGPAFRDTSQHPPIFPLPICAAIPSGPDSLPECTLRNAVFSCSLPPFSITLHLLPLPFRFLSFRREGGPLPGYTEGGGFEINVLCQSIGAVEDQRSL